MPFLFTVLSSITVGFCFTNVGNQKKQMTKGRQNDEKKRLNFFFFFGCSVALWSSASTNKMRLILEPFDFFLKQCDEEKAVDFIICH